MRREAHPAEIPSVAYIGEALVYQKSCGFPISERILFNYTSFHLLVNGVC